MGGLFGGGGDSGASDAADAQVKAQQQALDFYKQVFNKQLELDAPSRAVGNQALQALGGLYGFNAGVDPYPVSGVGSGAGGSFGSPSGNYTLENLIGPQVEKNPETGNKRDWVRHCSVHPEDPACSSHFKAPNSTPANTGAIGAGAGAPGTNPLLTFLQNDPGYKFELAQGQQTLDRQAAAGGRLFSGGQIKAGQRYAQDYAGTKFGEAYNRLASLAGIGQTANANTSQNLGQLGQNVGQGLQNIGDARASGYINGAQGKQNQFNNLLNTAATAATVATAFSSRDYKEIHGDVPSLLEALRTMPVYEWTYKAEMGAGTAKHIGGTAEDWAARFGGTGKEINLIDAVGVLIKSVQELAAKVERLEAR